MPIFHSQDVCYINAMVFGAVSIASLYRYYYAKGPPYNTAEGWQDLKNEAIVNYSQQTNASFELTELSNAINIPKWNTRG